MSKLTIVLSAQPNLDFAATSHQGSVSLDPREVEVATLKEAIQVFAAYIAEHNLGSGNIGGESGLIRRDGVPLCKVALNLTLWEVDSTGRETGQRYERPRFAHAGEICRYLREAADLTRNEMSDSTGVAASTIRNLETRRHVASAWTWSRLLAHPAMADFGRFAAESGLKVPPGGTGGGGPAGAPSAGGTGGAGQGGGTGSGSRSGQGGSSTGQ